MGLLGLRKPRRHAVVHVLAAEAYPVALPSGLLQGVVRVPFAGEEQEQVALLYVRLVHVRAAEHALALKIVEQLVFVEHAPLVEIKVVSIGMAAWGMGRRGLSLRIRLCSR